MGPEVQLSLPLPLRRPAEEPACSRLAALRKWGSENHLLLAPDSWALGARGKGWSLGCHGDIGSQRPVRD